MIRPILTLKNPVLQTEQTKPVVSADSLKEIQAEKTEEKSFYSDRAPILMLKLFDRFPKIFDFKDRKPLKVGIDKDILEVMKRDSYIEADALKRALRWYVNGSSYMKGIIKYKHRVDLDGNVSGEIDTKQKLDALSVLESRKATKGKPFVRY